MRTGDGALTRRAWSYPHPDPGALARVGADFSGYVASRKEVRVG